jgi:hypothetical protein
MSPLQMSFTAQRDTAVLRIQGYRESLKRNPPRWRADELRRKEQAQLEIIAVLTRAGNLPEIET